MLYDGQGSVRHHNDAGGDLIAYSGCDTFAYDAYGQRVDPLKDTVNEGLFYTGEQWDNSAQMYYLRARYYGPLNGRFNQLDPYEGNPQDPQSLHKYLYCHNNPVNNIDSSGKYSMLLSITFKITIVALLLAVIALPIIKYSQLMAPRGNTLSVNFSNFDLSGVELANGNTPDETIIKENILRNMTGAFEGAGITVNRLIVDSNLSWTDPELSFTNNKYESRDDSGKLVSITWGHERIGSPKGKVHLGNFSIPEFNGKFKSNEDIATAISFLSIHESGHIYKLGHLDRQDNYMRRDVLLSPGSAVDEIVEAFIQPSRFTQEQLQSISSAALTGKR